MRAFVTLLGLARYALLAGLVVLGLAAWTTLRAGTGVSPPALRDLKPVGGLLVGGREVSLPRRPREGGEGATTHKFFELDLQTESGAAPLALRVDHAVGSERLGALLNRRVTVHYDPKDVNRVYAVQAGGQDVLRYAEMAALMRDRAGRAKDGAGAAGTWMAGVGLVALGGAGIAWRRRLAAAAQPA